MEILHENSGLAMKLVKFFGEPIKTPFSNINFWNKTKFFIYVEKQWKTFSLR